MKVNGDASDNEGKQPETPEAERVTNETSELNEKNIEKSTEKSEEAIEEKTDEKIEESLEKEKKKKEKKKKWSFRSISFSKKDKSKPNKDGDKNGHVKEEEEVSVWRTRFCFFGSAASSI